MGNCTTKSIDPVAKKDGPKENKKPPVRRMRESHMFDIGKTSIQGYRETMEDEILLHKNHILSNGQMISLYAIFDGHGGSHWSKFAKDNFMRILQNKINECKYDMPLALHCTYIELDKEGLNVMYNGENKKCRGGTTAISILIDHSTRKYYIANTGDSRAIKYSSGYVNQLTVDHRPDDTNERNRITGLGGYVVHKRVMGELAISRAIGDADYMINDQRLIIPIPDIYGGEISSEDDYIILACDGLYDAMTNRDICLKFEEDFSAQQKQTLDQICKNLACLAEGSCDNVSIILIKLSYLLE